MAKDKKEQKKKGGFFSKLFGGKEEGAADPSTPAAEPGPAAPAAPADGITMQDPNALVPEDAATIPPGYIKGAAGGADPFAPGAPDPFAGSDPFAPPKDDLFGSSEGPLTPPGRPDPFTPPSSDAPPHPQDLIVTQDPDGLHDLGAPTPAFDPSGATFAADASPAPGSADPFGAPLQDEPAAVFNSGESTRADTGWGAPAAPAESLEVFDVELDAAPPPVPAGAKVAPSKPAPEPMPGDDDLVERTLTLDAWEPPAAGTTTLPQGAAAAAAAAPPPAEPPPAEPRAARTQVDMEAVDLEALEAELIDSSETPPAAPAPVAAAPAPVAPPPVAKPAAPPPRKRAGPRPLFAEQSVRRDGSRRLGTPAAEVKIDTASGVVIAPAVEGGWADLPPGFEKLSDGSVLGRIPRAAKREPDGGLLIPPAPPRRSPVPDGPGKRVPPFPAGVRVDRATGVAYAPAELVEQLQGSPEDALATEDGGLVLLVPSGVKWNDDGSYVVPPAPPEAPRAARSVAPVAVAPEGPPVSADDPAHGRAVALHRYLGIEEVVHEDGWSRAALPEDAVVADGLVILPRAARSRPGAVPAGLEVEERDDGRLALRLPAVAEVEGRVVWIAPPFPLVAERAVEAGSIDLVDLSRWGEPIDVIEYLGIVDSLHANGWARLDLPEGARVEKNRLRLPVEYAAAGAVEASWFLLDDDGWLSCELPEGSERLGDVVLVPPPGARAPIVAARPEREEPAAPPPVEARAAEPEAAPSSGKRSSAMDRFRSKKKDKDREKEPEPPPPAAEAPPSDPAPPAAETPPAEPAPSAPADPPAPAPEAEAAAETDEGEGEEEPADAAPAGEERPTKRRGRRKKK